MGKQYIPALSVAKAHESDILDVEITDKFTITVSSDGYAKFWDNTIYEGDDAKERVVGHFINKLGVHHVAAYENILPNNHVKIVITAFACFDGQVALYYYLNDDVSSFKQVDAPAEITSGSWCPGFYKDPESKEDLLVVTQAKGSAVVFSMHVDCDADGNMQIDLQKFGELDINKSLTFPNSLAINQGSDRKAAIGFTNGDVLLFDLITLKLIYTFRSTDLQITGQKTSSNSIPRVIEFSPGGSILAVARDSQSAGSIALYDVKYGENIGSLTTPSHSSKATVGGFAHEGWIMGLSFDESGGFLASCGFDNCVRIWNMDSREREATIKLDIKDLEDTEHDEEMDNSVASGVKFVKKGVRGNSLGTKADGLCVISFDRAVRWYREAGGL
ncbi:Piso0_000752 [Millerozyma farinosa CBS 7064]|uniref:Piso0_000752 protein n=1 Tax=Pichia sorbitophila (strain ATCC MYA-4447 / BCRC 22081 / CBS 7064 / NBRC 10061 / NRRL Y-12695) TaxID=559304 RepID=G8YRF0_PICSO|nr:Piso0_000752 [Millerozyma farinosa CBS 7064]